MIEIKQFDPSFKTCLPETFSILRSAGLVIHPSVTQITLHGSRGPAGNYRPDSDIDLSLLISISTPPILDHELENYLQEVIDVTLSNWRGPVEVDLAVIFPLVPCKLICFQKTAYDPSLCPVGGIDCFGIYKIQKGFPGFVLNAGIKIERMYPCITIWEKQSITHLTLPRTARK